MTRLLSRNGQPRRFLEPLGSALLLVLFAAPGALAQTCDYDMDGFTDIVDNCPRLSNPSQANEDMDQLGDDCDPVNDFDFDGDEVDNEEDNCPIDVNPSQSDADADGTGDVCDSMDSRDIDFDGVENTVDNCPLVLNPTQANADGDPLGDDCDFADDLDYDVDAVPNTGDNCPFDANADQLDSDADGLGDVCDAMGAPGVDDYQCYAVKDLKQPPFVKVEDVSLADDFSSATAELLKVANVCAPVDREGAGILDPLTHRCCYKVKAPKLTTAPVVVASEAIQNSTLEVKKATTVCVPCTVTIVP